MSYGVFVVDNSDQVQASCKTILGYRDLLRDSVVSGTGYSDEDPDYPVDNILDDSYYTEYSPDLADRPTTCQLIFTFAGPKTVNYFMLCSKNAQSSGLSVTIEVYDVDVGAYENVGGFGSMTNGVPVMKYFDDISALSIRVTFDYSAKPYIMSMMAGEAIVFPRTFSLGAQPASMAYLDEVEQFDADEGLNIVNGRRLSRGKQLKGSINYVSMDLVRSFWDEYANHVLNSKPFCVMWNDNIPSDVIYGIQNPRNLTKPSYKTSLFSQIDFEVLGWA